MKVKAKQSIEVEINPANVLQEVFNKWIASVVPGVNLYKEVTITDGGEVYGTSEQEVWYSQYITNKKYILTLKEKDLMTYRSFKNIFRDCFYADSVKFKAP